MNCSIEISLYPLKEDYKERIINFILELRKNHDFEIITNGMSTQLFGDYDVIMGSLVPLLKDAIAEHRTMAVLKIGDGLLKPDGIAEELK